MTRKHSGYQKTGVYITVQLAHSFFNLEIFYRNKRLSIIIMKIKIFELSAIPQTATHQIYYTKDNLFIKTIVSAVRN